MKYLSFISIVFVSLHISCNQNRGINLIVDIPVEGDKIVSIFNISTGRQVYQDTLLDRLSLDSLGYGIHLFTIMWPRDIINVDEFKSLRPHTLDDQNYYTIQKPVFIDPNEARTIRIYTPEGMSRDEIESHLLSRNQTVVPLVDAAGEHVQLYEEYETMLYNVKKTYLQHKDSLTKQLYAYNDQGDLQNSAATNLKIKTLWENTFLPQMKKEEKSFLTRHADKIIVPFILLNKITDQATYRSYEPIIEIMPEKYKKLNFIQALSSLRNEEDSTPANAP